MIKEVFTGIPRVLVFIGLGIILAAVCLGCLGVVLFNSFININDIINWGLFAAGMGGVLLIIGIIIDIFSVPENTGGYTFGTVKEKHWWN